MGILATDVLAIQRGVDHKKATIDDILSYILANVGTTELSVADLVSRNAIANKSLGDRVFVTDASADPGINAGWGIYSWNGTAWLLIAKEEGVSVVVDSSNLSLGTITGTNITVDNTNGTGFTLAEATATNAGLLAAVGKTKLDHITVNNAVDLDSMLLNEHPAAFSGGASSNNPIVVNTNTQELTFSISNLTSV